MGFTDLIQSGLNWTMNQASNAMNTMGAAIQNQRNNQFQREMAEYAYSKDLEMWNKANEYNTPAMQMQRFEDAGLNKNLIYSQGQPGLAAATMPKYQDVKGQFDYKVAETPTMQLYQDIQLKNAQIDNIKQITENNRVEQNLKALKLQLGAIQLKYADKKAFTEQERRELDNAIKSIEKLYKEPGILLDMQGKRVDQRHKKAQILQIAQQMGLTDKQIKWLDIKLRTYEKSGFNVEKLPWWAQPFIKNITDLEDPEKWEDF